MMALRALAVFAFALCLLGPPSPAQSHKEQAAEQYRYARQLFEDLQAVPKLEMGPDQYELVIRAFEKVHRLDPASGYVDDALYRAAQVRAEMAGRFASGRYRQRAAEAYRFMASQYPHSKLAPVAARAAEELAAGAVAPPAPEPEQAPPPMVAVVHRMPDPPARRQSGPAGVKEVRYWSHSSYTRVIVELDEQVDFKYDRLSRPPRLYFDLYGTKLAGELRKVQEFPVGDAFLKGIRVGQNRRTTVRIVFDLASEPHFQVTWLTNPARFVVELRSSAQPVTLARSEPGPVSPADRIAGKYVMPPVSPFSEPEPQLRPQPAPPPAPAEAKPAVEVASRSAPPPATATVEPPAAQPPPPVAADLPPPKPAEADASGKRGLIRALGLKMGRVVIDPGHGGHDTGSIGPTGLREKDLVLDVAQRLGRLVESRLGAEVVYTRTDDRFLSLKQRTSAANSTAADLFISIHANASRSRSVRGIETFYLNITADPWALQVASRENAAANRSIHELQDLLQKITLRETVEESREFANKVQNALYGGLAAEARGLRNRGVRKAPMLVLMGAKMPAVLAEIGFISNPTDEKLMKTSEHREKIAIYLFNGIAEYAHSLGMVSMAQDAAAGRSGLD